MTEIMESKYAAMGRHNSGNTRGMARYDQQNRKMMPIAGDDVAFSSSCWTPAFVIPFRAAI
jgi:hypothetical protein